MSKNLTEKIKANILKLTHKIKEWEVAYYDYAEPIVTDDTFDLVHDQLKLLERAYPEFKVR